MSLTPVAGPVYCPDQGERDEGRVGLVLMDDALRVGIDAARSVVRGEPFEQELTERVCRVFQADAGAGITQWRRSGATVDHIERLVMSGCGLPRLSTDQLALVERAAALHPSFPPMVRGWNELRVSDSVDLRRFWRTDVYAVMHGHCDGRFPTALALGRDERSVLFLGIHLQVRDLDDTEMECLAELGRPLRAALEFRRTLNRAIERLGDVPDGQDGPFSSGEAEVIALVSLGWTTTRIARRLGLSESGVRHRLASARDRIGAGSRAELVSQWTRLQRAN